MTLSVDLIASQLVDGWFGSSLQSTRLLAVTVTLLMIYFELAVRNHERGYKLIESSNIFYEDFVKDLSAASISIHNEEFR